jgi:hypothetical protein
MSMRSPGSSTSDVPMSSRSFPEPAKKRPLLPQTRPVSTTAPKRQGKDDSFTASFARGTADVKTKEEEFVSHPLPEICIRFTHGENFTCGHESARAPLGGRGQKCPGAVSVGRVLVLETSVVECRTESAQNLHMVRMGQLVRLWRMVVVGLVVCAVTAVRARLRTRVLSLRPPLRGSACTVASYARTLPSETPQVGADQNPSDESE